MEGLQLGPGGAPGLQRGFQAFELLNDWVGLGLVVPKTGGRQLLLEAFYPDFSGVQVKDTPEGSRGSLAGGSIGVKGQRPFPGSISRKGKNFRSGGAGAACGAGTATSKCKPPQS